MAQSERSAAGPALTGVALALVTIVIAVIIVAADPPLVAKMGLGVVGALTLICAGITIGYALAIIRVREKDDEGDS